MVAAAAMGRAGHLRAAAARWVRARQFSTNRTNGGNPATPGGGAATNGKATGGAAATNGSGGGIGKATGGGGAATNGGAATGGGAATNGSAATNGKTTVGGGAKNNGGGPTGGVTNGNGAGGGAAQGVGGATGGGAGGSGECTSVGELRREAFQEIGRVWDGYNRLSEVDRILFEDFARVQHEMGLNSIKSKEDLVSTTYKMIGSAGVFVLTFATWASPYLHDSVVNDTVKEVERRARMRKVDALLTEGSADTAADGAGSDDKSSAPAAAPPAAAKGDTTTAGAPAAAAAAAKCAAASLE